MLWVADYDDGKIYAYDMATKARVPGKDFETLWAAGNYHPGGIWSDGATMWVADGPGDKIYAYDMTTRERVPGKDFETLKAAGNDDPEGIWSDGVTMWVSDDHDHKIYAYNMPDSVAPIEPPTPVVDTDNFDRKPSEDFDGLDAAAYIWPYGIWSDGVTMWVANSWDLKIYAYDLATKAQVPGKDFDTLQVPGHNSYRYIAPQGIWSDGVTMWVPDDPDHKIYAYDMTTRQRVPSKEFETLQAAGNDDPEGIWSDGVTMWVVEYGGNKIYAYDLVTKQRDPGKDFALAARSYNPEASGPTG